MKSFISFLILIFCLLSINNLSGSEFLVYGPRALGIGGACTAISENAESGYWNPAGLGAQRTGFDFYLPFGAGVVFTGNILENANNIAELSDKFEKIEKAQKTGGTIDVSQFAAITTAMKNIKDIGSEGKGAIVNTVGGIGIRIGRYTFAVNNYTYVGIKPYTDFNFWLGSSTASGTTALSSLIRPQGSGFEGIVIDTTTVDTTTVTPESTELATDVIPWLKDSLSKAGVEIPSGISDQELANALVNAAIANGVSTSEIQNAIKTIKDNKELIINLLSNANSSNPFANNQSNLTLRGINITEISLSSSRNLLIDDLYIGASLKILIGNVGYYRKNVFEEETELQDTISDLTKKYTKQSIQPAVDLGIMFDKRKSFLRSKFGIVAKNINKPKFDLPDEAKKYNEEEIYLEPQIRAGVAFYPLNFWSISSDVDLTDNPTLIPGYKQKIWALGTEINIINKSYLNLPLRFGIMKNIEKESNLTYTGGFGLNILHFVFDLAGSMSSESTKVNKDLSIPSDASLQLSISLNF